MGLPFLSARQEPQSKSEEIPGALLGRFGEQRGPVNLPRPQPHSADTSWACPTLTQGCEGLDAGVTRLSTVLGLWPWGDEQTHGSRHHSRHPNYVGPPDQETALTRPSAHAQPVRSRPRSKCSVELSM